MSTGGGVGQEEGQDHRGHQHRNPHEGPQRPEGEEVVLDVGLRRHQHSNI